MASINEDRLWMRRMSVQAKQAEVERWEREMDEDAEREARTCAYCFHEKHVHEIGAWGISPDFSTVTQHGPLAVTVLRCRTDGCICGVPPCPSCGSRIRRRVAIDPLLEVCAACGESWDATLLA